MVPIYSSVFIAIYIFPLASWSWDPFDWTWIEGWVFIITFTFWICLYVSVLNERNPQLLRNKMKYKKEKKMENEKSK